MSRSTIIQGIKNKKPEIIHILDQFKAYLSALEKTLMPSKYLHKIPKYTVIAKVGTLNRRNHGEVAIYIYENIPQSEVKLTTQLQTVAVTVSLKAGLIICNL